MLPLRLRGSASDEGGILYLRLCLVALPNPCSPREGADLCPAQLQLFFGAAVAIGKGQLPPRLHSLGAGEGGS